MNEYESILKTALIKDLKTIIKKYITHVNIKVSKRSKPDLISDIMKHTELHDGKICLKRVSFDLLPSMKKDHKKLSVDVNSIKNHTLETDEEKKMKILENELYKHVKKHGDKANKKTVNIWEKTGLLRLKIAKLKSAINNEKSMTKVKKMITQLNRLRKQAQDIVYMYE